MQAMAMARNAANYILDFALPPRCPGCGAITDEQDRFCITCWQSIHWLAGACCERCGLPFAYDIGEDAQCGACLANAPNYDRLRAAVAYGDVARRVVLKLKYGGKPGVARTLAGFMQRHLADLGEDGLLVPVPLHRWRIWRRGYNQSALIASALARLSGHSAELDVLRRIKRTPVLRGLSRSQRVSAMRGAFIVPERARPLLAGRTVILVDDVHTSGATANACATALKRAGAATVNLLCWARVVGDDVDNGGAALQPTTAGAEHAAR